MSSGQTLDGGYNVPPQPGGYGVPPPPGGHSAQPQQGARSVPLQSGGYGVPPPPGGHGAQPQQGARSVPLQPYTKICRGFLGGGYSDSPGGSYRMPGYGGLGAPPPDRAGPSAGRAKYDHACHVIIISPKLVA